MKKVKKQFDFTIVAIDVVIFTIIEGKLHFSMIKVKAEPYTNYWALPGGMVGPEESVDEAVVRHLDNKVGVKKIYTEQVYTFGDVERDPRGRIVSVGYMALAPFKKLKKIKTNKDYSEIKWFSVDKLPTKIAYDHKSIIKMAISRLQGKLEYTNIICNILSKEFTLTELQSAYEIILGKELDKRNFRKKILSLDMIKKLDKKKSDGAHRPAYLYQFVNKKPQIIEIL